VNVTTVVGHVGRRNNTGWSDREKQHRLVGQRETTQAGRTERSNTGWSDREKQHRLVGQRETTQAGRTERNNTGWSDREKHWIVRVLSVSPNIICSKRVVLFEMTYCLTDIKSILIFFVSWIARGHSFNMYCFLCGPK
jgi:hypothetical protein